MYTPDTESETFITTGYLSGITLHENNDIQYLIDGYVQKREEFLIKQIG
ncbi:hypothetical protein KKG31_00330 [Patescibacteria group bacterium]|nr:hypothetical protein [Patescibacteria group bacterium]MBU1757637.1 hypothetical protein [Patescibacteria group bacterium]